MSTCIVIPARRGSKGLPGKNTRDYRGFPLVEWSLCAGLWLAERLTAQDGGHVVCSSDDPVIGDLVQSHYKDRIQFRDRSVDLASDVAGMAGVVLDAAGEADRYILLQPTTPLRLNTDLEALSSAFEQAASVASCTTPFEAPEDLIDYPAGTPAIETEKTTYRQARAREFGFVDGAFYAGSVAQLRETGAFLHADTYYHRQAIPMGADIDTAFDWAMAEALHDWLQQDGAEFVQPDR